MTEADWLGCTDPLVMLDFLQGGIIVLVDELPTQVQREAMRHFLQSPLFHRKLRLFACACCRHIWQGFKDERSRKAVIAIEQFIDGNASNQQLTAAGMEAIDARNALTFNRTDDRTVMHIHRVAANAVWQACSFEFAATAQESADAATWMGLSNCLKDAQTYQAQILHCIFCNPFRPVAIDPAWLAFNDGAIRKLAQTIYDDRAFDKMPALADALKETGCDDQEILAHCRGPEPHVRGCWVLDLILGRE